MLGSQTTELGHFSTSKLEAAERGALCNPVRMASAPAKTVSYIVTWCDVGKIFYNFFRKHWRLRGETLASYVALVDLSCPHGRSGVSAAS